ncbi:MAG TPA: glycosyltransferase [Tepidisphaeraceae bacterium]|jgi:MGT family glycosyltransferase|nr:glycosyltransferase [Tepidisphaeraceae bacterium]
MTKQLNFLFTTWEGGGNVTPMLEAVRKLVARGHRAHVMSEECNRSETVAAGAAFTAWNRAPSRKDRSRESQVFQDWAAATPQEGLLSVVRDIWCGPALSYARDVIEELKREPADLVVTTEALFGVMAGCESLGQPFATLSANISLTPLPGVPPLGPGLAPARNDQERAMHDQVRQATIAMFDSGLPALNTARAELGLGGLEHLLDQFHAARVELLATSRAFDFPCDSLPTRVRYTGPQIADPKWAQPWTPPWPATDTRPLVAVGFSTTFQNHAAVLQNVIDALAPLPTRVLITLGGSIKANELRASDNCVLVESAPHSAVMRDAAVVITHGGHGTVMRALLSRVPMLVIPHGRDQNDNAIRITERGAGLSLMPNASAEEIRAGCLRLLNEPSFKAAAKRLGNLVAHEAESSTVVQELEAAAK